MAKNSEFPKTNAMRRLDSVKIKYEIKTYIVDENDLSGIHIADQIGIPYDQCFKTLVANGDKTGPVVFCIPCHKEIDLKRAASVTGNKKIEMIHVKDLLQLTGYMRGGVSPIGMKKKFPTYFHISALDHERITVSAGCKGIQLLVKVDDLLHFTEARTGEFCLPE
jgi:Cys-tRNA(Pro)/Cys-tRNA(Cys) deacylase